MASFALAVTLTKSDPEADRLLDRVRNGLNEERLRALDELVQYAQRAGQLDIWNTAGVGFHLAGQHGQATSIFEQLVQAAPDHDVYRLNLATSLSQTEQVERCRFQLRYVAEHGSTEQARRYAGEQLLGYEEFLGLSDRDRKLQDLQISSLRRALEQPGTPAESYVRLARMLYPRSMFGDEKKLAEATTVLEKGQAAFPDETSILEPLILCYLHHDPEGRLPGVVSRLEQVAPHSPVLRLLEGVTDEKVRDFAAQMDQRMRSLFASVSDNDSSPASRQAALDDLCRIVSRYPDNPNYRVTYAFALLVLDRKEDALVQARILDPVAIESHSFHFNLGQIFWIGGDAERGRHHLNLALLYAKDDQERQDARERIADLDEKRP
jgi:hypothetical protein